MSGRRLLAAVARGGVIGRGGEMAWRLPLELAHFKAETAGRAVVMGARTWLSLPRGLPGRRCHVVAERDGLAGGPGHETHRSLREALAAADRDDPEGCVVAGGARVYAQALAEDLVEELVLTRVDADVEGDALFPELPRDRFAVVGLGGWVEEAGMRWRVERLRRRAP